MRCPIVVRALHESGRVLHADPLLRLRQGGDRVVRAGADLVRLSRPAPDCVVRCECVAEPPEPPPPITPTAVRAPTTATIRAAVAVMNPVRPVKNDLTRCQSVRSVLPSMSSKRVLRRSVYISRVTTFTAEEVERARGYHRPLYLTLPLDLALSLGVLCFFSFVWTPTVGAVVRPRRSC